MRSSDIHVCLWILRSSDIHVCLWFFFLSLLREVEYKNHKMAALRFLINSVIFIQHKLIGK